MRGERSLVRARPSPATLVGLRTGLPKDEPTAKVRLPTDSRRPNASTPCRPTTPAPPASRPASRAWPAPANRSSRNPMPGRRRPPARSRTRAHRRRTRVLPSPRPPTHRRTPSRIHRPPESPTPKAPSPTTNGQARTPNSPSARRRAGKKAGPANPKPMSAPPNRPVTPNRPRRSRTEKGPPTVAVPSPKRPSDLRRNSASSAPPMTPHAPKKRQAATRRRRNGRANKTVSVVVIPRAQKPPRLLLMRPTRQTRRLPDIPNSPMCMSTAREKYTSNHATDGSRQATPVPN
ncbi:hypothetical protein SAMN04489713_102636 [Actinomadura madurae]|uniref:Uncharacterized protein n=1 Tax=Actinomadura madurae TaxID=1993 RepID=A0A1I5ALI7_9ACTN|nr:hypothetical protein SAMN04489713_102636 [Actinomadura madurae]